jgi:hypothetical protein
MPALRQEAAAHDRVNGSVDRAQAAIPHAVINRGWPKIKL